MKRGRDRNHFRDITLGLCLVLSLIVIGSFIVRGNSSDLKADQMGQLPWPSLVPSPSPEPSFLVEVSPTPAIVKKPAFPSASLYPNPAKGSYVIAAFGDSMVETMGENLDYLDKSFSSKYPQTKFKFYNYGIGSQNVVEALARFHNRFVYKTRNYPPIDKINADIIIISSFAYNPLSPYDPDKHSLSLRQLIQMTKATKAKVYLLAEIAPIKTGFGRGIGGIDWSDEMIEIQVSRIIEQLDNTVKLSKIAGVPLINAYEKSKVEGKYGNRKYVGTHDGIHPSIEGEIFMADLITSSIQLP